MALLLILALAAAAVYLIFFRSDSSQTKRITQKTSITLETTTPGETTAPPSVLYQGTIPMKTELTLPTEPASLPADQVQLDAQPVLQNPELPTGCEVTTLTAALNYAVSTMTGA